MRSYILVEARKDKQQERYYQILSGLKLVKVITILKCGNGKSRKKHCAQNSDVDKQETCAPVTRKNKCKGIEFTKKNLYKQASRQKRCSAKGCHKTLF